MSALSKLEAVNIVLKGIGESPVSSLNSGLPDAEEAEETLDETSKNIQESGWLCNRETNVMLARDVNGKINLPTNVLKVDASGYSADLDVVQRGKRLYNRKTHSYLFDKDVEVDIVYHLPFEELPYILAYYIAWVAAGRYQMRSEGSGVLAGWIKEEITEAKIRHNASEEEVDDANVFRDSESVRELTYRNHPRFGR